MEPVYHCMIACQDTVRTIRKHNLEAMKDISLKHAPAFQKLGGYELVKAVITKDSLRAMKLMNSLLEKEGTKKLLLLMLKDMAKVYKANAKNINTIIDCYMKRCSPEAREFTRESVRLLVNMITIMGDEKVRAEMDKIRQIMKVNMQHAMQRLQPGKGLRVKHT